MLGRTLRRGLQPGGDTCPAPDILAAYHEESLSLEEKENLESHLAACLRCQETLGALAVSEPVPAMAEEVAAAAAPVMAQVSAVRAETKAETKPPWFAIHWRWLVPTVSFAAVAGVALWIAHKPTPRPLDVAQSNLKTSLPDAAVAPSSSEVLSADAKASPGAPEADSISRAPAKRPTPEELKKREEARMSTAMEASPTGAVNKLDASRATKALDAEIDHKKTAMPPKVASGNGALFGRSVARTDSGVGAGRTMVGGSAGSAVNPPAPPPAPKPSPADATGRDRAIDAINALADQPTLKAPQQQNVPANAPLNAQTGTGVGGGFGRAQNSSAPTNAVRGANGGAGGVTEQVQVTSAGQNVIAPQVQQTKDEKAKQELNARKLDASAGGAAGIGALRGESVEEFAVRSGVRFAPRMIATPDANVFWRIGPGGHIARTMDGGKTWQDQTSDVAQQLISGSAPTTKICWVGGFGGTILRTTDGEHWEKVTSPAQLPWIRIAAAGEMHAVVTTNGNKSYATADGGRTWQPQ
jgi:hypothetical protein